MKLGCVLTATNDNPLYMDFIPIFVKAWNKLYPGVDVKIVFTGSELPDRFSEYRDNIIFFPPIPGVSTAFTSQYIRLLYPALLNCDCGVLITDMDMLPMNREYYSKHTTCFDDNMFVYFREGCVGNDEIAMCYNMALPSTWGEIFEINSEEDITHRLKHVNSKISYADRHGGSGWSTDQKDLCTAVRQWSGFGTRFTALQDGCTGHNRLDRGCFNISDIECGETKERIKNGLYTDYHAFRPYNEHKEINDLIIASL